MQSTKISAHSIYALVSVAISKHAEFPIQFHDTSVRASTNFEEIVTSIRSAAQISEMVKDGRYDQLSRSINIIGLVTSFGDFFDDVKKTAKAESSGYKKTDRVTQPHSTSIARKARRAENCPPRKR